MAVLLSALTVQSHIILPMDTTDRINARETCILCHNIRGINSESKWNSVKNNILETKADIVCLQETKRDVFYLNYLRKLCPRNFDDFAHVPSIGNSRGTLITWKGSKFSGQVVFENQFAQLVEFITKTNDQKWTLTNIYAPCTTEGRNYFLEWFKNIQVPDDYLWIIMGDFYPIRRQENRNKPGGDPNLMIRFSDAVSKLGLVEIPLSVQAYTWSNKQQNPLLERLDWFFISQVWSLEFPGTKAKTLARDVSDHVPCLITIKTDVPKPRVFIFENYWLQHNSFNSVFQKVWAIELHKTDPSIQLTAKLKTARKVLKDWQNRIPRLGTTIENTKSIIQLIDLIEENRDLDVHEWNFREILQNHFCTLLEWQKAYWKQRGFVRWVTSGDAETKFFHANATIRHRQNTISSLQVDDGQMITSHGAKERIL
jgi:exonuclease III